MEFAVHDDGTVTVRGFISIPADQAWFFTPDWLAGEREADEQIASGRGRVFQSAGEMFTHLDAPLTRKPDARLRAGSQVRARLAQAAGIAVLRG